MRRFALGLGLAVVAAALAPAARSQEPTQGPPAFGLNDKCGPYLVYVASFRGDEAARMAIELVQELRADYRVNAYWYSRTQKQREEQEQQLQRLRQLYGDQPFKRVRIPDEFAVVVGDYKSFDAARDGVERLKKMPAPKKVPGPTIAIAEQKAGAVRENDLSKVSGKVATLSPFRTAFPLRNPLLAKEQPAAEQKFDPLWQELNEGEKHSLLTNKGNYTLVVKTFQGPAAVGGRSAKDSVFNRNFQMADGVRMDPNLQRQLDQLSKASGWNLDAAALQARNLTEILRHKTLGYEAWVLHARDCSYVAVGSFKSKDDPEIDKLQRVLGGQSFGMVKLLAQPILVEVPREP
jgi:hypothetical protein